MTSLRTLGLGGAAAGLAGLLVLAMLPGGPAQKEAVRQPSRAARPVQASEPVRPATRARGNETEITGWVDTILGRPLFFPSRRPPPPAAQGPPPPDEPVPRLTGVLVSAASSNAIFAMDGKPRLARVGDRLGGFTVRAITPGEVRLEGPGGMMTLHPVFANGGSGTVGGNGSGESTDDAEEDGQPATPAPAGTPARSGTGGNAANADKANGGSLLDRLRAEVAHPPKLAMPPRPSLQSLIERERKSE